MIRDLGQHEPPDAPRAATACEVHAGFAELVRKAILKRWKAVAANEAGARGGEDVESVHAMRVATRRLRAALRVFAPYLPEKRTRRTARRLKQLTRALGAPREWDVHAQLLVRLHAAVDRAEERAALEHVAETVEQRRADARKRMIETLDRCNIRKLDQQVHEVVERAGAHRKSDDPPVAAWAALRPLIAAAMDDLAQLREAEVPDALHAMRIAMKRLRYALELLKDSFACGHTDLVSVTVGLQESLGRYHDHTLLEELVEAERAVLREHGRRTLADGLTGPLALLTDERHDCYAEFRAATAALSAEEFGRRVRCGLGMESPCGSDGLMP